MESTTLERFLVLVLPTAWLESGLEAEKDLTRAAA